MGPGTHIFEKITAGVQPKNYVDRLAMVHDINYMLANGNHLLMDVADDMAIHAALQSFSDGSWIMAAGLTFRKAIHLKETKDELVRLGLVLKDILLTDEIFKDLRFNKREFIL